MTYAVEKVVEIEHRSFAPFRRPFLIPIFVLYRIIVLEVYGPRPYTQADIKTNNGNRFSSLPNIPNQ